MKDPLIHKDPLLHIENPMVSPLDFMTVSLAIVILRYFPKIPEPDWRFRSPIGKLPFFDGVVLYGLVLLLACFVFKFIGIFLLPN